MKRIYRIVRWAVALFFLSSVLVTLLYRWVNVPLTPLMAIRCMQQAGRGEQVRLHYKWVPLSEMSCYLPVAVIASEDQNFLVHHGFDTQAIGAAMRERMSGGRMRGGSTISQQTAKNVFLWPTSSWVRKGFEVYLNVIEMGDGVYGAESVAQLHFGCSARDLKRRECALIAATLPNPLHYSSERPGPFMRKRQAWIERQMRHVPLFLPKK